MRWPQGVPAAVLAQHQLGLLQADVLGAHDFVGLAMLEHAVLMDAGFVGEGVLADDGLVALHLHAGDVRRPAGWSDKPLRVDAVVQSK